MTNVCTIWIGICQLIINTYYTEAACTPAFIRRSADILSIGDNVVFLCEIVTCKSMSKVIYEKTDVVSSSIWTPVYKGMHGDNHHALDTGSDYNLLGRVKHETVSYNFFLDITPVDVTDNGRWRCVVVDNKHASHKSKSVQLRVVPENDVIINPSEPNLVANQTETFTCKIDGIYPEPLFEWTITWLTSHDKQSGVTTFSKQHHDGLWYANNVIKITFYKPGKAGLKCSLTTQNGDLLMDKTVVIDIQAPATIRDPREEMIITKNASSTVVLICRGSGYRPRITWHRNGFDIRNEGPRLRLTQSCNNSFCTSTLTLRPIDPPLTCDNVIEYTGEYTCTVTLEQPYDSNQTSKPMKVHIMYPPLIKKPPQTIVTSETQTVTLQCEICSPTNITSEWTYNGKVLMGDNVKHQHDGSVKLAGNHPSGEYRRIVNNSAGSFNCAVYLINTDSTFMLKLIFIMVGLLMAVFVIVVFYVLVTERGKRFRESLPKLPEVVVTDHVQNFRKSFPRLQKVKERVKSIGDTIKRLRQETLLPKAPQGTEFKTTMPMTEDTLSIWRALDSECVFIGGQKRPSITVIGEDFTATSHSFQAGTRVVNGLFIFANLHMVNVYDETTETYSIYCVFIDVTSSIIKLLSPISTLTLHNDCVKPSCIFRIDNSQVGIYCNKNRVVEMSNVRAVFKRDEDARDGDDDRDLDDGSYELTPLNPFHVKMIKLTGYEANQHDMLCASLNGHICVLSYNYGNVYTYDQNGIFLSKVNTIMLHRPVHIQCFRDNAKAVIDQLGVIHNFDAINPKSIQLGENKKVQAAVFTSSKLWIIDGNDSTEIHVFRLNQNI